MCSGESEDTLEQVRMVWKLHQFLIPCFLSIRKMRMLQRIKNEEKTLANKILTLKFSIKMEISRYKSGLVTHANLDISDSGII